MQEEKMANTGALPPYEHFFAFQFEKNFDFRYWQAVVRDNFHAFIYPTLFAYLIAIFAIKRQMSKREAFELKGPLIAWNLLLAVFSFIGACRTLPEVIGLVAENGLNGALCSHRFSFGATGFWSFLFVISKIPEFIDTFFIVLRKKPLIFLHYYHHVETAYFSLITFPTELTVANWYISVNYSIHAIMYSYYALRAFNVRLPKGISMAITISQIVQMFIGLFVTVQAYRLGCKNDMQIVLGGIATYLIYALLFTNFFVSAYFVKPPIKASSKRKQPIEDVNYAQMKKGM